MGSIRSNTRNRLGAAKEEALPICSIDTANGPTGVSAASTVILGLQDLGFWAGLGFSLVALSTVVAAVEPFFNWRSRWILIGDTQYQLRRIRDELDFLLATHDDQGLQRKDVEPFFERTQAVWRQTSTRWLDERRRGDVTQ
jgi:hypothetical protein